MLRKGVADGARARRRNWLLWSVALLLLLDLALGVCVWQAQRPRARPHLHNAKVQVPHMASERESAAVTHRSR